MPKPKRKARGIVASVQLGNNVLGAAWYEFSYETSYLEQPRATFALDEADAVQVGCPRLKPGEVKKVRVVIEEVKSERARR